MVAYVIWFPHNRVRVLVFRFITEMPAIMVVGFWIVMQIAEGISSFGAISDSGGVAYLAHLGGAATGLIVAYLFRDQARYLESMNDARDGWFYGPP